MRFNLTLDPSEVKEATGRSQNKRREWNLRGISQRLPSVWDLGMIVLASWVIAEGGIAIADAIGSGVNRISSKNEARKIQRKAGERLYQALSEPTIDGQEITALSSAYNLSSQAAGIKIQFNPSIKL